MVPPLSDPELLVLGLVAEMPRHGYELDRVIDHRGMREWTPIGFSSIYFVLGKLERRGLVAAGESAGPRARKVYQVTETGRRILSEQTISALERVHPNYGSVLLGMAHWPVLERRKALGALRSRAAAVDAELQRLGDIQVAQQPLPDYLEALFDYAIGQLRAEAAWVAQTLDYMATKPWLEDV